ncbi:10752_t:CDS:2 [Entrophospora sp. SA101]|nr:10752_t:CDS:2 [Entrophospora sp. SA101]
MNEEITPNRIPRSMYKIYSPNIYFSYLPGSKTLQKGFLGITNEFSLVGILNVSFPADQPVYIKQIQLNFIGIEYDYLKDSNVVENGILTFCDLNKVIWNSSSHSEDYEKINDLEIPFELELPNELPSSINIRHGKLMIDYYLKATIIRKPPGLKKSLLMGYNKTIQLYLKLDRYKLPSLSNLSSIKFERKSSYGFRYDICINSKVFSAKQQISCDVKLEFFNQALSLNEIFIGLKEYQKILTSNYTSKTIKQYVLQNTIKGNRVQVDDKSNSKNEFKINLKLEIPEIILPNKKNNKKKNKTDNLVNWKMSSRNFKIFHKLKIKFIFGGELFFNQKVVKFENPIEIVKMLNNHQEQNLLFHILNSHNESFLHLYQQQQIYRQQDGNELPPPYDSPTITETATTTSAITSDSLLNWLSSLKLPPTYDNNVVFEIFDVDNDDNGNIDVIDSDEKDVSMSFLIDNIF